MRKLLSLLILFSAILTYGQGTPPQIPLGGSIGVAGSASVLGYQSVVMTDANYTLAPNEWAHGFLKVTSSVSLTTTRNVVAPLNPGQQFIIENSTTGSQSIQIIGATGAGITVPNGGISVVSTDGTNYLATGVGNNFNGTWSSSTNYLVNAIVTYNGITFISLLNSNLNQNPITASAYWAILGLGNNSSGFGTYSLTDTSSDSLSVGGGVSSLVGSAQASIQSGNGNINISSNFAPTSAPAVGLSGNLAVIPWSTAVATYAIGSNGELVDYFNASSAPITANLPAASNSGLVFFLSKTDSTANAVTITPHSGATINGASSYVLNTQYQYLIIQSDSSANWHILSATPAIQLYESTFTTTSSTAESVTLTGCTSSSHVWVQATNSVAAALTGVYVSSPVTNGFTLNHSATSGGTFNTFCTPN
jgi:hypothetical protein